ncbi:subtilisin-like protein [Neolentinus lepideus HHB14362 ss-1]|uniref:tripeptidyl-peptidase II n=1 Tax=Neolentinus lepideus HHB14362 ss-1 TaxID=1314782 RepID=A0A165MXU8_9AGAM|nr:subtilisin-like protein [Neolentinus lepideus HHB14362 ss-1]
MLASTACFAILLTGVLANPVRRDLVVHEFRENIPSGFAKEGPAAPETVLKLHVGLFSNNMAGLEKALYDVSTPASPIYGQHLSKAEVDEYVKPTDDTTNAVLDWFKSNNITATKDTPAGDWLSFSVPVSQANELFKADFTTFTHTSTGKQAIRTLSYSIPKTLQDHIELVRPTVSFPTPQTPVFQVPAPKHANVTADSCSGGITPACLQTLYGIPTTSASQSSNKIAVSGFVDQYANQADLTTFLQEFRSDLPSSTTFTLETLDGGTNPQDPGDAGVEANLDTQYTVGVASGVPVVFISVGDGGDGFYDITTYLLGMDSPPQVMTTSYGETESDISIAEANKLCNNYMQLGAQGVSVLFASGDSGVGGSNDDSCTSFVPTFPSGCPYMTSVGATTGTGPETAASFSSGGFSNYWGIPDYQASAVSSYLSTLGSTDSGLFNSSGRAYPDVAAQGNGVEIVVNGTTQYVAGTSCSSPIFASVIGLLNDELIAAGKSPLGFLNPLLYSATASAFTDITSGDNPGCNTNGFSTASGWDPVTGLGTPNYAALRTAVGL